MKTLRGPAKRRGRRSRAREKEPVIGSYSGLVRCKIRPGKSNVLQAATSAALDDDDGGDGADGADGGQEDQEIGGLDNWPGQIALAKTR